MFWRQSWKTTTLLILLFCLEGPRWLTGKLAAGAVSRSSWSSQRKLQTRDRVKDLWYHGFDNYMKFAFPLDELRPLSCTGRGPDWHNPQNFGTNDVAGNFSVTLVDVLDTFIILNDKPGFATAVRNVIDSVSFDVNTKPQVFETTIRVLGGLLSGHIFASDPSHPFHLPWYRGELLNMAHDLGERLLPAFLTPTGLPFARTNLRHGVPAAESLETCTAGAGSLILEFGTLSRLTGDERFEKAAFKAFFALWNRRSDIGLVGNTINVFTGKWLNPEVTSIGAGIDSFYEYALKWYIMSGESEFLDVWHEAYAAIMRYARGSDGFWFRSVNINTGDVAFHTMDSLSAFWPGLQVLAGDLENAIKSHLIFWNLWKRNSGMPEVWDIHYMKAVAPQYPLRPEFIESTYYLYQATKDPFYLDVGERILHDITTRSKVECGLTGIMDLKSNRRDDRMESFVLSETLKYLYLLFDESNPINKDDSNFVFTTEGHILTLDRRHIKPMSEIRRQLRRVEKLECPAYNPGGPKSTRHKLFKGIPSRPDADYARVLTGTASTKQEEKWWSPSGICEIPSIPLYSYDFIMSPGGNVVPEDLNPGPHKLTLVPDGFVLQNITGIRTHIVSRLDGLGYEISKLGPHNVLKGQVVYVNDSALSTSPKSKEPSPGTPPKRSRDVTLKFFLDDDDPILTQLGMNVDLGIDLPAFPAMFGADPMVPTHSDVRLPFGHRGSASITRISSNPMGCDPYQEGSTPRDSVLVMYRGDCTFLEKLYNAAVAGASGVIVISNNEIPVNPSADREDIDAAGDILKSTVQVVITQSSGAELSRLLDTVESHGVSQLMVTIDPERQSAQTKAPPHAEDDLGDARVLYLNGHPLLNTRLLI